MSLLVACGPAATPEVVEKEVEVEVTRVVEEEVEVVTTATPVPKGGELVVALPGEPSTLDPNVHASWYSAQIVKNVFDPLILVDEQGEMHPALAESWDAAEDNMSITFNLRQDVTFHDGTPFNAEAVKFNFDRIADPATESFGAANFLGPYDRTEVVDDYTAKVYWKEPYPFLNFINIQQGTYFMMNSPAAVEEAGEDYGTQVLVGTGPFMFKEWILGDNIAIERNPDYAWASPIYDHPQPYLDAMTFKFISEGGTRAAVLQTGEVDLIFRLPPEWVGRLATDPNFEVIKSDLAGPGTMYVISTVWPGQEDVQVRRALEYAVDRDAINSTVYAGLITPQYGPLSKITPCQDEEAASMYEYNPEKATEMLAEAGWTDSDGDGILDKDGEPYEMTIWTIGDPRVGEALQAQMQEIGIDAEAIFHTGGPLRMEKARAGDFGLMMLAWRSLDPGILRTLWHSEQIGAWNFSMYVDEELDRLLDEAQTIADMQERCEYYSEAQQLIMEQAIVIPLYTGFEIVGMGAHVKGVVPDWSKDNGIMYFDVYEE
jgi:peptide/nickel transport system substrate-binding protein